MPRADAGPITNSPHWRALEAPAAGPADTTLVGAGVDALDQGPESPMLVCRCKAGELELYVITDRVAPVDSLASHTQLVEVQIDRMPPSHEHWTESTDGGSWFAPDPRAFAARLRSATALSLLFDCYGPRPVSYRFDVQGFEPFWAALERKCPPPPASIAQPPVPSPEVWHYVDELPQAVSRVAPEYPPAALRDRLEGTVVVQARVGVDGHVIDAKVVKPVAGLDDAAVACVKQWTFTPARSQGTPVEIWVAIPVRFALH